MDTTLALPAILDGQHLVETFGLAGMLLVSSPRRACSSASSCPATPCCSPPATPRPATSSDGLHPNIVLVCALVSLVAILGAQTGFYIGDKAGPALFDREDNRLFKKSYVAKAEAVVHRYGVGRALVLGRFIPIVRTFLNPLVGAGHLPALEFLKWNVVGGVLWGTGVTLLGYFLGNVSFIGKNLEIFAIIIVGISVLPIGIELLKARRAARD